MVRESAAQGASTKPGSGDPGDTTPRQSSCESERCFNEAGVRRPRGLQSVALRLRVAPLASTKPGSGDPGDADGSARHADAPRFNEAGVRRPRGPVADLITLGRMVALQRSRGPETPGTAPIVTGAGHSCHASTKPGSGDPGDLGAAQDVHRLSRQLQRSRGPETPGTVPAWTARRGRSRFNEAGVRRPRGRRRQ